MSFANDGTYTAATGATTASSGNTISSATWNAIHTDLATALTNLAQNFKSVPVTLTGTSGSMTAVHSTLIVNASGTFTLTLLAASSYTGRHLLIKTIAGYAVNSASSNVVPLAGGAAGTAILSASAGKWAELASDGTNWIIMAAN